MLAWLSLYISSFWGERIFTVHRYILSFTSMHIPWSKPWISTHILPLEQYIHGSKQGVSENSLGKTLFIAPLPTQLSSQNITSFPLPTFQATTSSKFWLHPSKLHTPLKFFHHRDSELPPLPALKFFQPPYLESITSFHKPPLSDPRRQIHLPSKPSGKSLSQWRQALHPPALHTPFSKKSTLPFFHQSPIPTGNSFEYSLSRLSPQQAFWEEIGKTKG